MPKTTEELYQELLEKGNAAQQQANDLLAQYDNRPAFSYDPNTDGLYQAYKNQYVHQGRRAMEDTMGQAAGLTGGYGSTYGQSVGNQAYNEYLTKLNAEIPALYGQARSAYDAEGQRMLDRYGLALNAANTAYNQGRDALSDLRYDQNKAYEMVMQMISTGQTPSAELLAQAGVSADYAKSMAGYYARQLAAQNAGSGGSGGTRYVYLKGDGDTTQDDTSTNPQAITNAQMQELLDYAKKNGDAAMVKYARSRYGNSPNLQDALNWVYSKWGDWIKNPVGPAVTNQQRNDLLEYAKKNGVKAMLAYYDNLYGYNNPSNEDDTLDWLYDKLADWNRSGKGSGSGGRPMTLT